MSRGRAQQETIVRLAQAYKEHLDKELDGYWETKKEDEPAAE